MGTIVSLRLIQLIAVRIVTKQGDFYSWYTCDEVRPSYYGYAPSI
jgi:hypothetical protein